MNRTPDKSHQPKSPIRVVIVEDETWIRENLILEINRDPGLRCINSYRTAEEALRGIPADQPDVVLMDINLPGMDGVECVRRLRADLPEARYLMLTVYEESEKIFKSLLAGANGYLLKRSSAAELLEAIQQAHGGGAPMSSSIARKVVAYFNEMGAGKSETAALSPREQQVLELLAKGESYKNIADQLLLSIETIRMNVKHIYTKLHVHSRGEATAKYLQQSRFRHADTSKKSD
ncbi:MAG: response regulator transcription factor [Verrucomicrobiae bacterium]|nr:response regulator transcription factor [Verrucomicrobiae bacterium]